MRHSSRRIEDNKFFEASTSTLKRLAAAADKHPLNHFLYQPYKWGYVVMLLQGTAGGDLANAYKEVTKVPHWVAQSLNGVITFTTDYLIAKTADKGAIDALTVLKMTATQGANVYRIFLRDPKKKPFPAVGYDALFTHLPYTGVIAGKAARLVNDHTPPRVKRTLEQRLVIPVSDMVAGVKDDCALLGEYYRLQLFTKQQPFLYTATLDFLGETTKYAYKFLPFFATLLHVPKRR